MLVDRDELREILQKVERGQSQHSEIRSSLHTVPGENRRILVDFLVEFFEKGWVDQLIVTTFEESIIRRLHDHEKVSIIAL